MKVNLKFFGIAAILFVLVVSFLGTGVFAHGEESVSYDGHHEGMMSGFYGGMFGMGFFGWIVFILVVIVLVLIIVWLIKMLTEESYKGRKRK